MDITPGMEVEGVYSEENYNPNGDEMEREHNEDSKSDIGSSDEFTTDKLDLLEMWDKKQAHLIGYSKYMMTCL